MPATGRSHPRRAGAGGSQPHRRARRRGFRIDGGQRRLRETLDRLERTTLETTVYRHTAPAYPPLSGDGARRLGGRWNPPDSFPVVYTALDVATVDLELDRAARRAGLTGAMMGPRRLATIRIRLSRVLDLTSEQVRAALGVSETDLTADDPVIPRAIGETGAPPGLRGHPCSVCGWAWPRARDLSR
ncbi:MAG: RES domain-containing protein [Candidatus Limnocylindrales bacterium]